MAKMTPIALPPGFDLFTEAPRQMAIERDIITYHRPLTTISSTHPLIFELTTAHDEYLKLNETEIYLKFKIKIDKTNATTADWGKMSPINYFLHSYIKTCKVYIGGNDITLDHQNYGYKSFFEATLGFTNEAKTTHLRNAGFVKDSNTGMESAVAARWLGTAPSTPTNAAEIELMGKLHTDLTYQGRALLGGTTIKIELIPHSPSFYMISEDANIKPVVTLEDAMLQAHRAKVTPMMMKAQNDMLNRVGKSIYPLVRSEVRSFIIPSHTLSFQKDNIVHGLLPRRAFVAFVDNTAFNGTLTKNPYNFQHFNVNHLVFFLNGWQYPPKPYTPNFAKKLCAREYAGLYEALNQDGTDAITNISRDDFMSGHTIYGFNFSADLGDGYGIGGFVSAPQYGSLRLEIGLSAAQTVAINAVLYLEYDYNLHIDANRQASIDIAQWPQSG